MRSPLGKVGRALVLCFFLYERKKWINGSLSRPLLVVGRGNLGKPPLALLELGKSHVGQRSQVRVTLIL